MDYLYRPPLISLNQYDSLLHIHDHCYSLPHTPFILHICIHPHHTLYIYIYIYTPWLVPVQQVSWYTHTKQTRLIYAPIYQYIYLFYLTFPTRIFSFIYPYRSHLPRFPLIINELYVSYLPPLKLKKLNNLPLLNIYSYT